MAEKKPKYTSKGQRPNVADENKAKASGIDTVMRKMRSFLKGKKSYVTIDNPNTLETNKRKIRVPYSYLSDILTDWRKAGSGIILK